jgi:dTDP-4-amino-4,6-dideoxy-D-galactose acyltransferase
MLNVQRLDWDSEFFGFGVGRLVGSFESSSALVAALKEAAERGLRLVYGVCDHKDVASHQIALATGGRFVDAKRTYALDLVNVQPTRVDIEEAGDDACSRRQLRSLAWQAAEFSRFRVDPKLPTGSWRRMYSAWVRNSLNGQLADAVLVERMSDRIIGMITVGHSGKRGQIGLFAVDHPWRGRGVGRHLLDAAHERCRTEGCSKLLVVTQGDNIAACRSYERAGYLVVEEQDIFHFWIGQT